MAKKYKCPYCEKRLIRKDLITHIDRSHKELIPENYTAARLVYNQVNKVDHGKCRVCGKPTAWSEKSGRYDVLCGDPKCKEHMREEYKKNMLRVKGTYNILNDPEQQKKMLANRSISGQYKFQDGGVLTYTGSYEKKCLEFMDIVMQIPSKDILSPGPTLEYEYNGEKHFYITDFYYIPYNLIIEVKDGGDNLNTKDSASMKASREKTIEKEHLITDRGEYNYIRLTNNNFAQLIEVFMIIKEKLLEGDDSKTYRINESQVVLEDYFNTSDIRSAVNKIHQKYLKDKKPPTGNQNCQLCTWCVESWFRGINVLPRPIYSPTDIAFKFNGYDIVKNPELIKFRSKEDFKRVIHSSGNGSRYYVHVKWNGGSGGHEFMAVSIDNIIYIIDAQQGLMENIDTSYTVKDYFNINYDESYMVRLDNKQFNRELLKYNDNKYIKELTEDDMKMLEENAVNESLEDVSGIIFGKRKPFQDEITLYHGTDLKDLSYILPKSYNMGLKNDKPKMSSFWFNNIDYAITFATMTFIGTALNDKELNRSMMLDDDMTVLIEDKYKSNVISAIKGSKSYVYEKTIESSYVGYGHDGIFPEYTLDIPVKPDRCYAINDRQMLGHIKFVSEDYIKSIKKKYKNGRMMFDSTPLQQGINKMLYYKDHNDRVSKIRKARAYGESCELSSSNTGIINPQWKIFANYMCTKYKVNNSIKINIKFLHSKVSFDTMSKKYNDDASTNATIRDRNTIYVLDEDIYNNLYHDNYNNIVRYEIAQIILSKYYTVSMDKTIEAICIYESGMLDEFEGDNTNKIKRAKKYKEYVDANGITAILHHLNNHKTIIESVLITESAKTSFDDIVAFNQMLNNYEYIVPNGGDIISEVSDDAFTDNFRLLSPAEFEKYNGGVCWDYVVYEAYYFNKHFHDIPYSVYFEVLDNKADCPTHTFLIFRYDNKYYWFESSWKPMCGIYGGFTTEKDAVDYAMSKLDLKTNYRSYICKYDPLNSKMFGMTCEQYMEYFSHKVKLYKHSTRIEIPTEVIKGTTPEHKSY